MAFDQTPSSQTYTTKKISLVSQWEARDTTATRDPDTINCYYELINNKQASDKEQIVVSRDGCVSFGSFMSTNIRGAHHWDDQSRIYIAHDRNITILNANDGSFIAILVDVFAAGTTDVGFTEFNYDTGEVKIVASDGLQLMVVGTDNITSFSTSPDLPVPHSPFPVFLDGYLFLTKTGTADLYNSDLNDPLAYTAGSFITAEMLPDNLIRVARLNNYLVAFGSDSIEYFWDAAVETGSPLQRNDTPIKAVGFIGGLSAIQNKIIFVGNGDSTTPEVFMLEDFKIQNLGTPPLRRWASETSVFLSGILSFGGRDFYCITTDSMTYMVDLETKLWTRLKYQSQVTFSIKKTFTIDITGYGYSTIAVSNAVNGLLSFRRDIYQDNGVDFFPTIITDNEMFGSYRKKFGARLSIMADRPVNGSFVYVAWSDDDYKTYSPDRLVLLDQDFPMLSALGSFRRRVFKLVHVGNDRMRITSLEIDLNMGIR